MNTVRQTKFIYMGDPQSSRLTGADNDYSRWSALLQKALEICGEADPGMEQDRAQDKQDRGRLSVSFGETDPDSSCDKTGMQRSGLCEGKPEFNTDNTAYVLVLGGDLVNKPEQQDEWEAFFYALDKARTACGIEKNRLTVLTPTGNHGRLKSYTDSAIFAGNIRLPRNGPAGYEDNFYSYEYGHVHFIILDSNYMGNSDAGAVSFISEWIEKDLAGSTKPVTAAVLHHPFFTVGTSLDDDVRAAVMRDNYLGLLADMGVDLILCGHQHLYCRTLEINAGKPEPDAKPNETSICKFRQQGDTQTDASQPGITQIMGVSGTKYFHAQDTSIMAAVSEFVSAATIFETDGETIFLRTIDNTGRLIDRYSKKARGSLREFKPHNQEKNPINLQIINSETINSQTIKTTAEHLPSSAAGCLEGKNDVGCIRETGVLLKNNTSMRTDPLAPPVYDGIAFTAGKLGKRIIKDSVIKALPEYEAEYSVMRRGRLKYKNVHGARFTDLLRAAFPEIAYRASETDREFTGTEPGIVKCPHEAHRAGRAETASDHPEEDFKFPKSPSGSYIDEQITGSDITEISSGSNENIPSAEASQSGMQWNGTIMHGKCHQDECPAAEAPESGLTARIKQLTGFRKPGFLFVSRDGGQKALSAEDVFEAKKFYKDPEDEFPIQAAGIDTAITREDNETHCYNLFCGQNYHEEYNGRKWVRDIVVIQLINLENVGAQTLLKVK